MNIIDDLAYVRPKSIPFYVGVFLVSLLFFSGAFAQAEETATDTASDVEQVVVEEPTVDEGSTDSASVSESETPAEEPVVEDTSVIEEAPAEEVVVEEPVTTGGDFSFVSDASSSEELVEEPATPEGESSSTEDIVVADTSGGSNGGGDSGVASTDGSPQLTTDKADYNPGELVTIFGKFFSPVKNFFIRIFGNSEVGNFWSDTTYEVTTDEDGSFTVEHQLDNFYRPTYDVTATNEDGEVVAEMTFLDAAGASVDVFDQCANDDGDGYGGNPGTCSWTNGNMNAQNSTIYEEDGNVQRLLMSGLTNGPHVVTFEYQTTKGGKHAYDFLADHDLTENWVSKADLCSAPVSTGFPGCEAGAMTFSPNIPHDPLNTNGTIDTNQNIGIVNGTITAVSAPVLTSGSYAADSLTQVNVSFNVNTATCANSVTKQGLTTCPVFMTWSAHVSSQDDWGVGESAVNINGSPYHMKVVALDGASTGNRDNQMSADALVLPSTGTIIIEKITVGGNGGFDYTGDLGNFTLNTVSNYASTTFLNLDAGTYVVDESAETGWDFTNLSCVDPDDGTVVSGSEATIDLDAEETITCTYTNTERGSITIAKTVVGANKSFGFTGEINTSLSNGQDSTKEVAPGQYVVTEGADSDYDLTSVVCSDGNSVGSTTARTATFNVAAGEDVTCTFTNSEIPTLKLQKTVTNNNGGTAVKGDFTPFVDGATTTWDSVVKYAPGSYTASESTLSGYTASDWGGDCAAGGGVTLSYGDHAVCSITNTDDPVSLILKKQVINDNGGTAVAGDWTLYADALSVTGSVSGSEVTDQAGTYDLTESSKSGYTNTSITCDDNPGVEVTSVSIGLGQTKTCTFVNDDNVGHLIVHKVTAPADDLTVFPVHLSSAPATGTASATISTAADANYTVNAGTYSVTEGAVAGWVETNNTCVDVAVAIGETKECTITNTKLTQITIVKNAVPNDDQDFSFTGDFGNFDLDDDGNNANTLSNSTTTYVLPGTYDVSESATAGWKLYSATCDNGDDPDEIEVTAGDNPITCTFENHKLATVVLVKHAIGGNDTFDFTMTGATLPATSSLTTAGGWATTTFNNVDPDNVYSILEDAVPSGWVKNGVSCTNETYNGSVTARDNTSFSPTNGGTVTCIFTNNKPAAQIDLTPLTAYNALGDNHTVTSTVQVHNGDGNWGPAANGTLVTFSLLNNNNGAMFVGGNTCLTTDGSCAIVINSTTTGSVDIHAVAAPQVLGLAVNVATDGTGDNSADAVKTYVNARIKIVSDATNEVDDSHTFTVTVEEDTGSGWTGVSGLNPVVTFSPSDPGTITDNCDLTGTDSSGECTVEINSAVAGVFEADASVNFNVQGIAFNISTDGTGENSDSATKTYVDASIALSPQTGTNEIGDEHEITATVTKDGGTGAVPAAGVEVRFAVTSGTASFVGDVSTCTTNASGTCSISIVDSAPGLNEVDASTTVSVGGLDLNRATNGDYGPDGTDEAKKTYVDARISIDPQSAYNNVNDPHTFTIHVEENDGTGWADASGETVYTSLQNNLASSSYTGSPNCVTDSNGECTVTINSATPGTVDVHASSSVMVGGLSLLRETDGANGNSSDATKTYEAGKIIVQKVTVGGDGSFEFDTDYSANFFLMNGESDNSGWMATGTYSVAEVNVPAGWDLASSSCDNADDPSSITIADGDQVTCTFTNVKRAKLTIIKDAQPADLQDFDFNLTNGDTVDEDFQLDDDAGVFDGDDTLLDTKVFSGAAGLVAGSYSATETQPNEFWTFEGATCTNDLDGDSPFTGATPTATGVDLDLAAGDEVTCVFVNTKPSPTRTQGFWQTHLAFTTNVFDNYMGGTLVIGDPTAKTITNINELFGAFWANIAKTATGKGKNAQRSDLDKARMQLLQQLVAAELNCYAFGCDSSVQGMMADAHEAYSGNSVSNIINSVGEMDAFNNSGDTLVVGNTGKADPKTIKSTADINFWDTPASEL